MDKLEARKFFDFNLSRPEILIDQNIFVIPFTNFFTVKSNFGGSNIFWTIENCSRHGWFEPPRVNYGAVRKQIAIIYGFFSIFYTVIVC